MAIEYAKQAGPFVSLTTTGELDELFVRSNEVPVIIFKHSLTCSISNAAYQEIKKLTREVSLLVIQQSRDISVEVERRTNIRHESPQLIILRNGAAVWNVSHWSISAEAVERAAREND